MGTGIVGRTRAERNAVRKANREAAEYARAYRTEAPGLATKRRAKAEQNRRLALEEARRQKPEASPPTIDKYTVRRRVGEVLRAERKRRGLTLEEVATKIGKLKPYLSELERGHYRVDTPQVDRLCAMYDCDEVVDKLLEGEAK